ncbi:MAG: retron Ec67 family RNA-directed DNA polymerase/endonuclease [Gammaproteobacteria bacterium]
MALLELKLAKSFSDVADLLRVRPKNLAYLLYSSSYVRYQSFDIPKRNGLTRPILAPEARLKSLQSKLSQLLQDCLDEIHADEDSLRFASHGFTRNASIVTNAIRHRNKRHVLNVDIEDFFGSINFGRVRGYFIKNKQFELDPSVATAIAQIACHDNKLPQGSPCSPVISNLIAQILDMRMLKLAKRLKCDYSRYADDLTISTNLKNFPTELAHPTKLVPELVVPGKSLTSEIAGAGFKVNMNKTRLQSHIQRQDVTGLIVNRKINTRSEYWRETRAQVHSLITTDSFRIYDLAEGNYRAGRAAELQGRLSHIFYVDSFNRKLNDELIRRKNQKPKNDHSLIEKLTSREQTYKEFLHYTILKRPEYPLIICEGVTDIVYIRSALKSYKDRYPLMVVTQNEELQYRVKFLKPSRTKTKLMNYPEGASGLAKLIDSHAEFCRHYKISSSNPVIFLTDNDKAAKEIFNKVRGLSKKPCDGSKPSYHIFDNLFLVPIPKKDEHDIVIEQLFDPHLLSTELDGKRFNPSDKIDTASEYGKKIFAERVVRPNCEHIDFSRFRPLLDTISAILEKNKQI